MTPYQEWVVSISIFAIYIAQLVQAIVFVRLRRRVEDWEEFR